jgi:tetratricopeptide (TPR) repeat protein
MRRFLNIGILAVCVALPALFAEQKPPAPKSKAELEAIQTMLGAQDPDAMIKAAENLLTKYADTDFKALALYVESTAYQRKNDYEKMIVYAEQAIQADPKQYLSMLIIAKGIAQRTREFDLDREEKLTRAEKYAHDAMDLVNAAPKPNPQVTDAQWTQAKNENLAQAHEALGYIAKVRKNRDVAIAEMKLAIDLAPDPVTMVQLAVIYDQASKPDDALPLLDKVMAMQDIPVSVRQFAQAERVRATQMKAGPAKPGDSTPPPVEIKKQ